MVNTQIQQFFKDKRVMVTGHTGFIGSWLVKSLLMLGSNVCGFALNPYSNPNLFDTLKLSSQIRDFRYDILDRKILKEIIDNFSPEIVFHLAAQPIVLEGYNNPADTFNINVTGTVNLLDILRRNNSIREIVVMTSDKVYRNNEWVYPYREIDPLGGTDPYSASKSCQDIVVNSFRESYFLNRGIAVSTVRAGNVIGGGDWSAFRIVSDLVRGMINNQSVSIRNPRSTRPWQHVLNLVSEMLVLTFSMRSDTSFSGNWNFGPNPSEKRSVKDLTEKFISYWGNGSYSTNEEGNWKESKQLQLDTSKARSAFGKAVDIPFEEALMLTVDWYKTFYYDFDNVNRITEEQIRSYIMNGRYYGQI